LNTLFARAEGFAVESESYFTLSAATGSRTNNGISTGSRATLSLENLIMLSLTVI
jgi:hypothetical protein